MYFNQIMDKVFIIAKVKDNQLMPIGTCFALSKPGYFATVAHNFNGSDNDIVICLNDQFQNGYQNTVNPKFRFSGVSIVAANPLLDLIVFKSEEFKINGFQIGSTDEISPGKMVAIFGYPHSEHGRVVLTQQETIVGAKILLENGSLPSKHIVINIQARPGQSGGPILDMSTGKVIALLVGAYVPTNEAGISLGGIDPQSLNQTTHAVSAHYLEGMY